MITSNVSKNIQSQLANLRAEENAHATEGQLEFDFEGVHLPPGYDSPTFNEQVSESVSATDLQADTCYASFNASSHDDYELSYDILEQYREFAQQAYNQMNHPEHKKIFKKVLKEIHGAAADGSSCDIRMSRNLKVFKEFIDNI